MGNKARNDKGSILVDVERLLDAFEPAFMNMPKIRRIHGAAVRLEEAAYDIIDYFSIAYELGSTREEIEEKLQYVAKMIGAFGRMQSCFKRLMKIKIDTQKKTNKEAEGERKEEMYLFSDSTKLEMARCMESMEKGIKKWRSALRNSRIMIKEWSGGIQEAF